MLYVKNQVNSGLDPYVVNRVYEILDNVLSRAKDKQIIKEAEEIKEEIVQKQHNLRSKKQIKRGEEVD